MKTVRIVTPISLLAVMVVVILGLGVGIGGAINQYVFQTPTPPTLQREWSDKMEFFDQFLDRIPLHEDVNRDITFEDYRGQAYALGWYYFSMMDQGFFEAKRIYELHNFSSDEEIINFLNNEDYGLCRHRAPVAIWLLKFKNPNDPIRLVGGAVGEGAFNVTPGVFMSCYSRLDINHVWIERLEKGGKILEFMPDIVPSSTYEPYVYVGLKENPGRMEGTTHTEFGYWWPEVTLNDSAIQNQYLADRETYRK